MLLYIHIFIFEQVDMAIDHHLFWVRKMDGSDMSDQIRFFFSLSESRGALNTFDLKEQ